MFYGLRYDRETGRITGVYQAATEEELRWQVHEGALTGLLVTDAPPDSMHRYVVRHGVLVSKTRVVLEMPAALHVGEMVTIRAVPAVAVGPPLRSDSFQVNGRAARLDPAGKYTWRTVLLSQGALRLWVDDAHYYSDPVTAMVK